MTSTDTITAIRTNPGTPARFGADAVITITYADGTVRDFGGKRAARATAVILIRWPEDTDGLGFYGARSNLAAAQAEARKMLTAGKHRRAAAECIVVEVTEAR